MGQDIQVSLTGFGEQFPNSTPGWRRCHTFGGNQHARSVRRTHALPAPVVSAGIGAELVVRLGFSWRLHRV